MDELEALRRRVAVMRELGVLQWDGLILGPPPPPQVKEHKLGELEQAQAQVDGRLGKLRMALASSGAKPSDDWLRRFDKAANGGADE